MFFVSLDYIQIFTFFPNQSVSAADWCFGKRVGRKRRSTWHAEQSKRARSTLLRWPTASARVLKACECVRSVYSVRVCSESVCMWSVWCVCGQCDLWWNGASIEYTHEMVHRSSVMTCFFENFKNWLLVGWIGVWGVCMLLMWCKINLCIDRV